MTVHPFNVFRQFNLHEYLYIIPTLHLSGLKFIRLPNKRVLDLDLNHFNSVIIMIILVHSTK
jgi:hypothetical protein